MKALTIWQPWASLIVAGAKPYEFRGWRPPRSVIGQRIAIHAGARAIVRSEVEWLIAGLTGVRTNRACLHADMALPLLRAISAGDVVPARSHVLATAVLGEPKPGNACAAEFGIETGGNDSDREHTFNWGWPLTGIEPLVPPVPCRGAQGLWNWSRSA